MSSHDVISARSRRGARRLRVGLLLLFLVTLLAGSAAAQRSARTPPGDRIDLVLRQSQALLRRGDTAAAIELLEPLLAEHPREKRLAIALAEAHLRAGEPRIAAARIEEALHQHRLRDLDLWVLLSRAYRQDGDGPQAVSALLSALRERPAWAARLRDDFELLVSDSLVGEAALESFSGLALASNAPDAWREILAHLYVVSGRDAEALALVAELDRSHGADGRQLFLLARTLADRGIPELALAAFDSVLAAGADADLACECGYERGRLLERLERFAAAVAAYARAVDQQPDRPLGLRASLRRGELLLTELGERAAAESLYTDLLARTADRATVRQIRPLREEARLGLAECALQAGDFALGAERFAALEESALRAELRERAAFERAEMLFYAGDFAGAETAYYDLTDRYPQGSWVNDALARVLLLGEQVASGGALKTYARCQYLARTGQRDSALAVCRGGLSVNSQTSLRPVLRLALVELLLAAGRLAEADSTAAHLLALDPQSRETPAALLQLAQAFEGRGAEAERARECYETLVLQYPDSWEARRARARLDVLRTGEEPS